MSGFTCHCLQRAWLDLLNIELADLLMQDVEQNNKGDYDTHLREVNKIVDGLYDDAIKGTIIDDVAV